MKTQDELKEHYRDVIIPMVDKYNYDHGTDVKPWECVLVNKSKLSKHPDFLYSPENYTFAITILEGRPVFWGDRIYSKSGEIFDWCDGDYYRQITHLIGVWIWIPPKKRTFMLSGVELPCPVVDRHEDDIALSVLDSTFWFRDCADRDLVAESIVKLLTEARDKE